TGLGSGCAYQAYAWQCQQLLGSLLKQVVLVGGNGGQAYVLYITDGSIHGHHASNIWRARLKPLRYISIRTALETDGMNHVATALPGRHILEHIVTGIQCTHARWPIELVPRENVKITAYGLHIHHLMGNRLCAIDQ